MSICVSVVGGDIVASADVYPACTDFALVTVAQIDRLTFWADLAIELEPGNGVFWPLLGAMFAVVGVVLGLQIAIETARTFVKEA